MPQSLFDIQVNGFAGIDFQSASLTGQQVLTAIAGLAEHQTRRFFAAIITDAADDLVRKFTQLEAIRVQDREVAEALCGYHLEGPWLSKKPGYRGAHPTQWMAAPSIDQFAHLQEAAGGNIRLVTLAPELPGAISFIRYLVDHDVAVSLGHTDASQEDIDRAIDAGARFCTHLGNGVPAILPRHDNVVQRLLARDELTAFFIPDGIHIPPDVFKNMVRAKPAGRVAFTSDCMAAAGAPPGQYALGQLTLEVADDGVVRLPGTDQFAGSALCPDDGVHNAAQWLGWSTDDAREAFSSQVAAHFSIALPEVEDN